LPPNFNTLANHKILLVVKIKNILLLVFVGLIVSCHSKVKERKEEVYSRHLQKHISLTIISTPPPENKSDFNLLLLNDGMDKDAAIRKIFDSIYQKKMVNSLIIVGIHAFDPGQEYGVAGFSDGKNKGGLASKYADFIVNELLPFIKKKSGVRSFRSVSIAGFGIAGISAIDIAWDNWQKFDKVGFLPEFANSNSQLDFSLLSEKILKSRKKPKLQFWLDQSGNTGNSQRNDSTSMEHLFDVLKIKGQEKSVTWVGIDNDKNRVNSFSDSFSQFLIWINGKN
jgi:predicted alpha/beta superfamily hydrolase